MVFCYLIEPIYNRYRGISVATVDVKSYLMFAPCDKIAIKIVLIIIANINCI